MVACRRVQKPVHMRNILLSNRTQLPARFSLADHHPGCLLVREPLANENIMKPTGFGAAMHDALQEAISELMSENDPFDALNCDFASRTAIFGALPATKLVSQLTK